MENKSAETMILEVRPECQATISRLKQLHPELRNPFLKFSSRGILVGMAKSLDFYFLQKHLRLRRFLLAVGAGHFYRFLKFKLNK